MPRFLFYVPAVTLPIGGVNVIFEWAALLRQGGFDAHAVCTRQGFVYPFLADQPQTLYDPVLHRAENRAFNGRERVLRTLRYHLPGKAEGPVLTRRPDDIIVVPEFAVGWLPDVYPENPAVLLVQNYWPTLGRLANGKLRAERFAASIAISDVCARAARMMPIPAQHVVPLAIDPAAFPFARTKKRVIAYMPRKRRDESAMVARLLAARGRLPGWELRALDGVPREQVAATLAEAALFLSFSEREGFGLPPAEAMASGCIVIGHSGVGGAEFFDSDHCFPIADDDVPSFVDTVEAVAAEYDRDPARLDAMRHRAAAVIAGRYCPETARDQLLATFAALSREIGEGQNNA